MHLFTRGTLKCMKIYIAVETPQNTPTHVPYRLSPETSSSLQIFSLTDALPAELFQLSCCMFWPHGHVKITQWLHSLYCKDLKEVIRSDSSPLVIKKKKMLLSLWKALGVSGPVPLLHFSSSVSWSSLIEVNQIFKMLQRALTIACRLLERTCLDKINVNSKDVTATYTEVPLVRPYCWLYYLPNNSFGDIIKGVNHDACVRRKERRRELVCIHKAQRQIGKKTNSAR